MPEDFPANLLDSLQPRAFTVERTDHGVDIVERGERAVQANVEESVFHREVYTTRWRLSPDEARAVWQQLGRVGEVDLG